jgi:hypothetical protein
MIDEDFEDKIKQLEDYKTKYLARMDKRCA